MIQFYSLNNTPTIARKRRFPGWLPSMTEDTAQKRVSRGLDKLRSLLIRQGVTLSVPVFTTLLADRCVASAPVDLGENVSTHVQQIQKGQ